MRYPKKAGKIMFFSAVGKASFKCSRSSDIWADVCEVNTQMPIKVAFLTLLKFVSNDAAIKHMLPKSLSSLYIALPQVANFSNLLGDHLNVSETRDG